MSTEQTTDTPASLDAYLKDPLSIPEGVDLEALAAGETSQATQTEQSADVDQGQATANKQGESNGDAPGTGTAAVDQDKGKDAAAAAEGGGVGASKPETQQEQQPAGVASKDSKHVIPYEELRSTRERAARAEIMVQELTGKLEAMASEIQAGQAIKTRDLADIVDESMLVNLREESPEIAGVIDKLIERNQTLAEQAHSAHAATAGTERETRVQAVISVEDAINAVPKLAHVRATDPDTFTAIAALDTTLGRQAAWKDRPLSDRFDAAVRMYETANGNIELPGQQVKKELPAQQLSADTNARVAAALAKADAATSGPSTLSDIPGGQLAAESTQDALTELSSTALTERFMSMSPDQIEAELARLG